MDELRRGRRFALIVGIDAYENGIAPLSGAAADAKTIAEILCSSKRIDRYEFDDVRLLTDREATRASILAAFESLRARVAGHSDVRLVVYYAGHGIGAAASDDVGADSPGYFLPQDAVLGREETYLSMRVVRETINSLAIHHMLLVLDCCFAGAFRWSGTRAVGRPRRGQTTIERFQRYLREPAWTVITSAASDELALDTIGGKVMLAGSRGPHKAAAESARVRASSPFAIALAEALSGEADVGLPGGAPDGVITAAEVYFYISQRFDDWEKGMGGRRLQKPLMFPWPDKANVKGEFIFVNPKVPSVELESAGPLLEKDNPYRGLRPYEYEKGAGERRTFFGRDTLSKALRDAVVAEGAAHVFVIGGSGTGKSSLVAAGLLPLLDEDGWDVRKPWRPGGDVGRTLKEIADWLDPAADGDLPAAARRAFGGGPPRRCVVVIDQVEELLAGGRRGVDAAREAFFRDLEAAVAAGGGRLRVVYVVRSDHAQQLEHERERLRAARVYVTPMTREELREAIVGPAEACVLQFHPPELVDTLVSEVADERGALPLLSFTLSQMYLKYVEAVRGGRDVRAMLAEDYKAVGGVLGSLTQYADGVLEKLGGAQADAREVLLRAVSYERGSASRRPVDVAELRYADARKTERVKAVVDGLVEAQLMVVANEGPRGEPRYEFAHNRLLERWSTLQGWISDRAEGERLEARQRLRERVHDWKQQGKQGGWVDGDPRLEQWRAVLKGQLNAEEEALLRGSLRLRRLLAFIFFGALAAVFAALLVITAVALVARSRAARAAAEAERLRAAAVDKERVALRAQAESRAAAIRTRLEVPGREVDELAEALVLREEVRALRDRPVGVEETVLLATLLARRSVPLAAAGCDPQTARLAPDAGVAVAAGAGCTWDLRSGARTHASAAAAVWCDEPGAPYTLQRVRVGPTTYETDSDGVVRLVPPAERRPIALRTGVPCALRGADAALADAEGAFVDGTRVRRVALRGGEAELLDEGAAPARRPHRWRVPDDTGRPVAFAGFSPDGERLFTTDGSERIDVWDASRHRALGRLRAWEPGTITFVAVSPSGRWLLAASDIAGRTIAQVFDLSSLAPEDEEAPVGKVSLPRSVARGWFVAEGAEPRVAVELADGSAALAAPVYRNWAFGMTIATETTPGAVTLDAALVDGASAFLQSVEGTLIYRRVHDERLVEFLGRSPDTASEFRRGAPADRAFADGDTRPSLVVRSADRRAALAFFDDHATLWQLGAAPARRATVPWSSLGSAPPLVRDPRKVDVAFVRGDRLRIVAEGAVGDGALRVWDVDLREGEVHAAPPRSLRGAWAGRVHAVALSPQADRVAVTVEGDRVVRILDAADGALRVNLRHENTADHADFAADGRRVVTTADGGLNLWAADGALLAAIPSGLGTVYQAEFVGAGARERVVTLSADLRYRAWSIAPEAVVRSACDRLRDEAVLRERAELRAACGALPSR